MFVFPFNAASEVVRSNADMQFSIFLALSRGMIDASSSLGRLNMQSGLKMLEEASVVFSDALRMAAGKAAQSAIPEYSRQGAKAMQSAQQESFAASFEPANHGSQFSENDGAKHASAVTDQDDKATKSAGSSHEHEVDPRPSPLLEKLVASVASDTNILDR